jgi:hypothetical protein
MNTEQIVYLLCTLLNVLAAGCCSTLLRRRTKFNGLSMTKANVIYSFFCVCQGILSTIALLLAYDTFHLNFGHGAAFFLILLFSLCLTVVLVVVGIIVIGWEPMRW